VQGPWNAYVALGRTTIGPAGSARRGDGWFAMVSGEQSAELNMCGLTPGATARLEELGFSTAPEPEALMVRARPPTCAAGPFRIRRAAEGEMRHGIAISAEAHEVDRGMLERTLARTPRDAIGLWLAWDESEPISAVWLVRHEDVIGVWSMMTPRRHQRRGAGRAVLTAALADIWSPETRFAVLMATPAGRRLYASIGFAVADEVTTSFRGIDAALLEAIGQGAPPG
jgi:GNAT superfamily N-acetyltransferase